MADGVVKTEGFSCPCGFGAQRCVVTEGPASIFVSNMQKGCVIGLSEVLI